VFKHSKHRNAIELLVSKIAVRKEASYEPGIGGKLTIGEKIRLNAHILAQMRNGSEEGSIRSPDIQQTCSPRDMRDRFANPPRLQQTIQSGHRARDFVAAVIAYTSELCMLHIHRRARSG
jgi:hypothetical protein